MDKLQQFSERKRLPVEFLIEHGVEETDKGIRFANGAARARVRKNARTAHPTYWASNDGRPMRIYGYDRVEQMAAWSTTVLVVEGESCSLSAWFHKKPALGVPGATMHVKLELEDVLPFERAVVVREPGEAGVLFAANVPKRLRELGYAGAIIVATLPTKDLADLHAEYADDETAFDSVLDAAINAAQPANSADARCERTADSLSIVRLDTVQPERVEWLWRSRIPLGKVSLLVGDPGSGKSFASLAIAASVTTGAALPDSDAAATANVVAYNAEDGLEDTVRPRAELCGVALDRFHAIRGTEDAQGRLAPFTLSDIPRVADAINRLRNVRLVIIDPIASLLAGVDSHRDAEVRASLQVLVELAAQTCAAVLVVMHLRKAGAERALYRVGGSIGFTGLARSVLLAGVDPADGRRAIVPIKQNLAAPVDPIEYRLDAEGRFWWGQRAAELSADRLLGAPSGKPLSALDAASAFLEESLAGGPRTASEVSRLAKDAQISDATLKRAREALKVKIHRTGFGKDGRWVWSLPIDAQMMSAYDDTESAPIEARSQTIDTQTSSLSAYGDSMSTYETGGAPRGGLSDHGRLCRNCKTLNRAYDCGDGTFICGACADGAA